MFERFTAQAREVVVGAQHEARRLHHPYIGTEHLLLALLGDEESIAYAVLRDAGVTAAQVRGEIERRVGTPQKILSDDDAAALRTIGIDLDAVLERIEQTFGPQALRPTPPSRRRGLLRRVLGDEQAPVPCGPTRFAPRSKKVLELALREAVRLDHRHIGSEHILLGLLREGEGLAAKILTDAGVDLADLRRAVEQALRRAA
jgi:ATP-dependent Clp protease ATP-binding subunit ClpA